MQVKIEFSGGCELLFDNKTSLTIDNLEEGTTMQQLILLLKDKYLKEKPELFMNNENTSIRPGILVIINDTDWELVDELQYKLQDKDNVVFISTLHGG
ncbi:hypothetical protein C9374_008381 [Naegleria lovaniensis]|uniref:Ubiquitin-related modifier 1 homolog n=1 Tax=Naegleria lovaniensis TaxID=51637 RepID=A0AA88KHW0_NAELO|nr:uncharacterized protein C9374_008381 [Naegleria lovaniensis]KAG2378238.1 hypothetical protein C9374_008381 [Naegleria lovaniensis]